MIMCKNSGTGIEIVKTITIGNKTFCKYSFIGKGTILFNMIIEKYCAVIFETSVDIMADSGDNPNCSRTSATGTEATPIKLLVNWNSRMTPLA